YSGANSSRSGPRCVDAGRAGWVAGATYEDGQRVRRQIRCGGRRAAHPDAGDSRVAGRQGRSVDCALGLAALPLCGCELVVASDAAAAHTHLTGTNHLRGANRRAGRRARARYDATTELDNRRLCFGCPVLLVPGGHYAALSAVV